MSVFLDAIILQMLSQRRVFPRDHWPDVFCSDRPRPAANESFSTELIATHLELDVAVRRTCGVAFTGCGGKWLPATLNSMLTSRLEVTWTNGLPVLGGIGSFLGRDGQLCTENEESPARGERRSREGS